MEGTRKWKKASFTTILLAVISILLCDVPCTVAADYTIRGDVDGPIYLFDGDTCELLLGGHITGGSLWGSIIVFEGSVLNVYGGEVDAYISVELAASASVKIYGETFSVGGTNYNTAGTYEVFITPIVEDQDPPPGSLNGPLTGFYEDGSGINLNIQCAWEKDESSPTGLNNGTVTLVASGSGTGPEEIQIDIKPGSYPNSINLGSNGVVPVAILSSETFDATAVDPNTVELAGEGVAVRGKGSKYLAGEEDVDGDGLMDLVVKVETENLDPDAFQDGGAFLQILDTSDPENPIVVYEGWDEITIVPE